VNNKQFFYNRVFVKFLEKAILPIIKIIPTINNTMKALRIKNLVLFLSEKKLSDYIYTKKEKVSNYLMICGII
jgi:hypothetical protein